MIYIFSHEPSNYCPFYAYHCQYCLVVRLLRENLNNLGKVIIKIKIILGWSHIIIPHLMLTAAPAIIAHLTDNTHHATTGLSVQLEILI